MKKPLLTAMCIGTIFCMSAQTVIFEEDFEWLEPWSSQKPAGQTVETDNAKATAQQIGTNKVDEVSTYEALIAKGYTFPICCAEGFAPREAKQQIYLQRNYLKFGLTGYYSGITFPALAEMPDNATTTISFDWCSQRQVEDRWAGHWDKTELVIVVENNDADEYFYVPTHSYSVDEAYAWLPVTIDLGTCVNKDSKITIRNADGQWPAPLNEDGTGRAFRWFLDNVKITYKPITTAVEDIAVDSEAPVEYYTLQGTRIINPENGLYIVRQGNSVRKAVIK